MDLQNELNEIYELIDYIIEKYEDKIGSPLDEDYNNELDSCICQVSDVKDAIEDLIKKVK